MFPRFARNRHVRPLTGHKAVVNLTTVTTTRTGLIIQAQLDQEEYPPDVRVQDWERQSLYIRRTGFQANGITPSKPGDNGQVILASFLRTSTQSHEQVTLLWQAVKSGPDGGCGWSRTAVRSLEFRLAFGCAQDPMIDATRTLVMSI